MAKFDMITRAPKHILAASDEINNRYFTIDTADLMTVYEWLGFNPLIVTHACHNDEVIGFFNIIPLTQECGQLFSEQAIKEEDLAIEHILPPEAMQYAQSAYLAAIAIKDRRSYRSRQCAAALLSTMADHLLHAYDLNNLKRIYANPTTFDGNHMVRKLGLKPVVSYKKPLKGNDIYAMEITPESAGELQQTADRYKRFVGKNAWSRKAGS